MSDKKINFKIITHEKEVFEGEVDAIYSKGTQGEFGVLPNHIAFMCALDIGVTKIEIDSNSHFFATMGGIFQFQDNTAVILTDEAINGKDVDIMRAKDSKKRAEIRLHSHDEEIDMARANIALAKAMARLKAANEQ